MHARLWPLILVALTGCYTADTRLGHEPPAPAVQVPHSPPPPLAISGELVELVRDLPSLRTECRPVRFPSAAEIELGRRALRHLLAGELERAREVYALLDFELLELHGSRSGPLLIVKESAEASARGWGFVAVNPAARRPLILEAAHPQHDWRTGVQAAELMLELEARALLVSTTHRCASKRPTRCQGRTGACRQVWGRGRYRRSDRAHTTRTLFHAAHVELMETEPALVAVQIHGFSRRPGRRRHVIISDGTRLPGQRGNHSNGLARAVRSLLPRDRWPLVRSCNETSRQRYLCGTHNVQGRHTNGSPQPCSRPARRSANRFLQIELSLDARMPGGVIDARVLGQAMAKYWAIEGQQTALGAARPQR